MGKEGREKSVLQAPSNLTKEKILPPCSQIDWFI